MKNELLTPLIIFLFLLLLSAMETTCRIIGFFEQFHLLLINTYFMVLLAIDVAFVFILIRDLKYSNPE
jgi:hypothetical protein